jgi:shikimate dehydrogenase
MRLFGLIGHPLTHSFSQRYFTNKFEKEGLTDCRFENFSIPSIDELPGIIKNNPELEGLAVTIPYKQQVLKYLSDQKLPTGLPSCNCIAISNGKLTGYNTDHSGFEKSLLSLLKPHHRNALVLGTGGAAAAVTFVLKKLDIHFTLVSRTKEDGKLNYADIDEALMETHTLIINTTPLGTYPAVDTCPDIPYGFITQEHLLYDLTYNPEKSLFLQKGEEQGAVIKNGEEMLVIQAEENWRLWS